MRPTTRTFLAKLNLLQALAAIVSLVLAYISPDVAEGPHYLERAFIFYSLFVLAGILIALWIYLDRASQAQSPSLVTSDRHSPRLRRTSFDDDLSSESFASSSRLATSYEPATAQAVSSSAPASYTHESAPAETVWVNPSTGCSMLNGPGGIDTSGHLWMQ